MIIWFARGYWQIVAYRAWAFRGGGLDFPNLPWLRVMSEGVSCVRGIT